MGIHAIPPALTSDHVYTLKHSPCFFFCNFWSIREFSFLPELFQPYRSWWSRPFVTLTMLVTMIGKSFDLFELVQLSLWELGFKVPWTKSVWTAYRPILSSVEPGDYDCHDHITGNYGSLNKVVTHLVTYLLEFFNLVKIMHLELITVLKFILNVGLNVYLKLS